MYPTLESFRDLLVARCVEPEGMHLLEMLHVGLQELIEGDLEQVLDRTIKSRSSLLICWSRPRVLQKAWLGCCHQMGKKLSANQGAVGRLVGDKFGFSSVDNRSES
jgi:hypothetical protein